MYFNIALRQEHLVTDAYVQQLLLINPMPALVAFYFEKCVLTEEVKTLAVICYHSSLYRFNVFLKNCSLKA